MAATYHDDQHERISHPTLDRTILVWSPGIHTRMANLYALARQRRRHGAPSTPEMRALRNGR